MDLTITRPTDWNWTPVLDPDFDELGGSLTCAQWRDPIPVTIYDGREITAFKNRQYRRQRKQIRERREWLHDAFHYLRQAHKKNLSGQRSRLRRLDKRFRRVMEWQVRTRRQPRDRWLQQVGEWLRQRLRWRLRQSRGQLAELTQRLHKLKLHQTDSWPAFHFAGNTGCNKCIPYNWQFTPGYWRVGQVDRFE